MIATWMLYATAISSMALLTARAVEPIAVERGLPRRLPWAVALAAAVLVPLLVAIRPQALQVAGPGPRLAFISTERAGGASWSLTPSWSIDTVVLVAWLLASLVLAGVIASGIWRLHRAARAARSVVLDGEVVALTDELGPGARSFGSPRIVIPAWLTALDPVRRALLVRHEVEHVRAGDPALLVATLVAVTVMPWNLPLWFMARALRTALELDCDARVLKHGASVRAYGDLLLTVASHRRAPRLAAYLSLAPTPSQLERRILTMTLPRQRLGAVRRFALMAGATVCVTAACETRRPQPLAPVTTYSIVDGVATPASVEVTPETDSSRARMKIAMSGREPSPGLRGAEGDPLVTVYDAEGTLVLSGHLGARGPGGTPAFDSIPVDASEIASVDVIKNPAVLPPEARGGLVKIVLKPGVKFKAVQVPDSANRLTSPSEAPPRSTLYSDARVEPTLVIVNSQEGRELYREVLDVRARTNQASPLDGLPIEVDDVATVNVFKPSLDGAVTGQARVVVTLKAGKGLVRGR